MTYNEVRSVAKNTPGVKAKGKKADLISAISQATTLPSAAPPSLAAIDTCVASPTPVVHTTSTVSSDYSEAEAACVAELEALMLGGDTDPLKDSPIWDELDEDYSSQQISNNYGRKAPLAPFKGEMMGVPCSSYQTVLERALTIAALSFAGPSPVDVKKSEAPFWVSKPIVKRAALSKGGEAASGPNPDRVDKGIGRKYAARVAQKENASNGGSENLTPIMGHKDVESKLNVTAKEAAGGVFSPTTRANLRVLQDLLGSNKKW